MDHRLKQLDTQLQEAKGQLEAQLEESMKQMEQEAEISEKLRQLAGLEEENQGLKEKLANKESEVNLLAGHREE